MSIPPDHPTWLPVSLALLALTSTGSQQLGAANLELAADNAVTTQNWNSAVWRDVDTLITALTPKPGDLAFSRNFTVRTPDNTAGGTFLGSSLTINTGGQLLTKHAIGAANAATVNLILAGGNITHGNDNFLTQHLNGTVQVNAAAQINTSGTNPRGLVINSVISGTGNLTFNSNDATDVVTLTGNNSGYSGNIRVAGTQGILRAASDNALGSTSGSTTLTGDTGGGTTLEFTGNISVAENLIFEGRQVATALRPHLRNQSGNNTLTGNISFNTGGGQYNIDSAAGILTIQGIISPGSATGGRTLNLGGAATGVLNSSLNLGSISATVVKRDAGLWQFNHNNSYSGGTQVSGGTLMINNSTGSGTGSGTVLVEAAGTLSGNGSILGNTTVQSAARLSPGGNRSLSNHGVATLTLGGSLNLLPGSTTVFDLASAGGNLAPFAFTSIPGILPAAGEYDALSIANSLTVQGNLEFILHPSYTPLLGDYFVYASYGSLAGTPDPTYSLPALPAGMSWTTQFTGTYAFLQITPEPARTLLLMGGMLSLLSARRRT